MLKSSLLFFCLVFSFSVFAGELRLEKSSLADFAKVVSDYLGKPVIISQGLEKPFSINADFKDTEELKELFKTSILASGLTYQETDQAIIISSLEVNNLPNQPIIKNSAAIVSPIAEVKVEKVVFSYLLQNISSTEVFDMLNKNKGSATYSVIDSISNNSLVVTGTKQDHKAVKKLIAALDVAVKQVVIEAVITELSDNDYAGLDGKMENFNRLNTFLDDSLKFAAFAQPMASAANFGFKLLTSKSLKFFLDWIETSDSSEVLSKPKIMTLDRKPASIIVGQNVPFVTGRSTSAASSTATPFQTIERKDIGLTLKVTPVIFPSGKIQLSITQEFSTVAPDTQASDIVTNKRAVNSTALIADGDVVLLGGLSSDSSFSGKTATAPFQDIPVLGWLFSGNTKRTNHTNLVVMISAQIVK